VTNRHLDVIADNRQGKPYYKAQTCSEIETQLALKDAQIQKCESELEASKADAQRVYKLYLDIKESIEGLINDTHVIKDGIVTLKTSGGQRKTKSKKSKKSKKRKYKRSKHRHTKKPN
jgi:hypothetical protein